MYLQHFGLKFDPLGKSNIIRPSAKLNTGRAYARL